MRLWLLATAFIAMPLLARAQPVTGLYVGAGAGANFMQTAAFQAAMHEDGFVLPGGRRVPASNISINSKNDFDTGGVAVASIGYGFGNGVRVEGEADYRYNAQTSGFSRPDRAPREQKFGGMVNALFDLDIGSPHVFPYFGGGIGYMRVDRAYGPKAVGSFAYQGIAGLAAPIPWVRGLSLTVEYRFMGLRDVDGTIAMPATARSGAISGTGRYESDFNHSLLVGLRYAFDTPEPPPPAPVASAPVPLVQPARTYLVFFDWDRADLTDRARQIIAEAATTSTRVQTTRIEVQGNADRSGTPAYNQGLSLRRAQTVAAELVRRGVASSAIDIEAFGDTRPLVPTAAGVREPQNRRVAIILR